VLAVAGLAMGVFVTAAAAVAAISLARRAFAGGKLGDLEVDRLLVRQLKILDR
jgi:hypothetical protein